MLSVYADYVAGTIPETAVIGVKLCLRDENAKQLLDRLQGQREAIEWLTGMALAFRATFGPRISDADRKEGKSSNILT